MCLVWWSGVVWITQGVSECIRVVCEGIVPVGRLGEKGNGS